MGRGPSKGSSNEKLIKKGRKGVPWSAKEDQILMNYIKFHGESRWTKIARQTGLERSGKSCRLRWLNYLRPDIKRGNMSIEEEDLIIRLHKLIGNRWSLIAGRLPGRTDNEIKNYWNTILTKKKKKKEEEVMKPAPKQDHECSTEKSDSSAQDHVDMISNGQLIDTCSKNNWVTKSMTTCDDITQGLKFTPTTTENGYHCRYDIHFAPKKDEYDIEKCDSSTSTRDHFSMISNEQLISSTCSTNSLVTKSMTTCDDIIGGHNFTPNATENIDHHGRNDGLSWDILGGFHDHAEQFCVLADLINNFDFSNDFLLD